MERVLSWRWHTTGGQGEAASDRDLMAQRCRNILGDDRIESGSRVEYCCGRPTR